MSLKILEERAKKLMIAMYDMRSAKESISKSLQHQFSQEMADKLSQVSEMLVERLREFQEVSKALSEDGSAKALSILKDMSGHVQETKFDA